LLIQQSRDESSSLKQQLAKQQEEQEKRHYGQKKSLPHVPITGSSSARLNSPGEGRSILATMWKRDRDSLRTVQQALEDSEDQLAFAKRQVLRLKKEVRCFQKHSFEQIMKEQEDKNNDVYQSMVKNKTDNRNSRSFFFEPSKSCHILPDSLLPNTDYDDYPSKSKLHKSMQLRPKESDVKHSDSLTTKTQDILDKIQQEKDFIHSTQKTLLARARLSRTRSDVDKELKTSLERSYSNLSLLESQLKANSSMSPFPLNATKIVPS
ncbi:hypothetical protein CU098_000618, partial [Rhizopus stolonifer]